MNTQQKNGTLVTLTLLLLGFIWGGAFILIDVIVREISPLQLVAARLTLGSLAVLGLLLARGRFSLPAAGLIPPAALLSVVDNLIPNSLVAWSETRIDSGIASILLSTMPMFTVVFAAAFLKEGTSPLRVFGIVLGFIGVMVVSDGSLLDVGSSNGLALLAVVGAACSHGIAAIYAKQLLTREEPLRLTGYKLSLGAIMLAPVAIVTQGSDPYLSMSLEAIGCLAILGVVATGLAYSAYNWVLGTAGSVQASLVTYVIPVFGVSLAWIVLGEPVRPGMAIGGAVIAAGVAVTLYAPRIWLPRNTLRRGAAPAAEPLAP